MSHLRLPPAVIATILGAGVLSGCSAFSENEPGAKDGVQVAAAFYPLEYVVERVAGEHAEVTQLTRPGGEPHDLELTVKQTGTIASADLVLYQSDFQPAVDDAVAQNASGKTLDATDVVELLPSAGDHGHEDEAGHEDDHEESHGDEHSDEAEKGEHAEEGHEHGDTDPHFWQDPLRVADLGDGVADALTEIDPDHKDDYQKNATALRDDLEALDKEYDAGLADCERDTIVVSHDAFGYLEKYGLHIESIVGLSPDATPTSAVIGHLQEVIKDEGITTVFSEPLEPALGQNLARDLDVSEDVLDPVEGLTDATSDQDYISLMESNLTALAKANGCS